MGSNQSDRSISLNRKISIGRNVAAGNSSFIVALYKKHVRIYLIDEPNNIQEIKLNEDLFSSAKMHPFYKTIFLTLFENEIKIWEISKSPKNVN